MTFVNNGIKLSCSVFTFSNLTQKAIGKWSQTRATLILTFKGQQLKGSTKQSYYYGLTIDFVKVDLAYFVNDVFVIESDKSESPMAVGDFIVSKHRLLDPTELFKVRFDVLQAG